MSKQQDPNTVILKNVRLSFPHLFVAKAMEGSKPKFSADLILDKKEHAAVITQLEKLIDRVALDKFQKKVPLKHRFLHDGNDRQDKEGYGDDVMFVVAKNDTRPAVVDAKKTPVAEADGVVYGGCYVNAVIRAYAFKHPTGGCGVSASLEAVQFAKDGPSFGATRINPDDVFDDVSGEDDEAFE